MDPLQWMGAVRMKVQTADKNITIIHTTPVHQLMSCKVFKINILGHFLLYNHIFQLKGVIRYEMLFYMLFEHKCVLGVCVHNHPKMIKIHTVA